MKMHKTRLHSVKIIIKNENELDKNNKTNCELCDKMFSSTSGLKKHTTKVHPIKTEKESK